MTPITGSTREPRRVPRRPVSDSRTDWRPATIAGASAARTPVTRPSAAMARISQGRTVSSPKRLPVKSSIIGRNRAVRPNPAPTPATAPTAPSTTPPASTTARTWARLPPHEPTRPSWRRERRAPTANAGPASSTISRTAMADTVRTAAVVSASVEYPLLIKDIGTSESGGGFRATWRDLTTTPLSLAARMSCQVTPAPAGPFTSHFGSLGWGGRIVLSRSAVFCHGAMTDPGSA
ncbi:hypothetical protein SBADM41S_02681 [Streptomyces badius]